MVRIYPAQQNENIKERRKGVYTMTPTNSSNVLTKRAGDQQQHYKYEVEKNIFIYVKVIFICIIIAATTTW